MRTTAGDGGRIEQQLVLQDARGEVGLSGSALRRSAKFQIVLPHRMKFNGALKKYRKWEWAIMRQFSQCPNCGNTKKFYARATVKTELTMVQKDDGKIGFVTDEDAEGLFLRINFKSANSIHNSVSIQNYEAPLRCASCHTELLIRKTRRGHFGESGLRKYILVMKVYDRKRVLFCDFLKYRGDSVLLIKSDSSEKAEAIAKQVVDDFSDKHSVRKISKLLDLQKLEFQHTVEEDYRTKNYLDHSL
ncbi:hypothetical protein [Cohnella phaseoli]|nr:hypothetical protein [Cohnella phaseoli]